MKLVASAPRIRKIAFPGVGSSPKTHHHRGSPLTRRSDDTTTSPTKRSNALTTIKNNVNKPFNPQNHLYYPAIILGYLQVAWNLFWILLAVYWVTSFYLTIQRDVQIKVDEQLTQIMSEIAACSKQYVENRCSPELRVPAMEKVCVQWENCMRKDPSVVSRARLSAETFAEILNSFIEPISYKTMVLPHSTE